MTETMPDKLAFTLAELRSILSVGKSTIYKLESLGLIWSVPGLRHKIYSRETVLRFLNRKPA